MNLGVGMPSTNERNTWVVLSRQYCAYLCNMAQGPSLVGSRPPKEGDPQLGNQGLARYHPLLPAPLPLLYPLFLLLLLLLFILLASYDHLSLFFI